MEIRVIDGFNGNGEGEKGFSRTKNIEHKKSSTNNFMSPGYRDFSFSRTNLQEPLSKKNQEPRDGGFSRVDFTGEAGAPKLQGFDRTLEGILDGYKSADEQDLNEWDFLVTMEHPVVLQGGIEVLQGKAKRQERKAARKDAKVERKQEKQARKQESMRPKKAERLERKAERKDRRSATKDVRLAKKEERVARREARTERRDKRSESRDRTREARQERKAGRGERWKEVFSDITDKGRDIVSQIVTRPELMDLTASDFQMPFDADQFLDRWRGMDPEDVLDEQAEMRDAEYMAENFGKEDHLGEDQSNKKTTNLILGIGAVAGVAMLTKKKKGKKK